MVNIDEKVQFVKTYGKITVIDWKELLSQSKELREKFYCSLVNQNIISANLTKGCYHIKGKGLKTSQNEYYPLREKDAIEISNLLYEKQTPEKYI